VQQYQYPYWVAQLIGFAQQLLWYDAVHQKEALAKVLFGRTPCMPQHANGKHMARNRKRLPSLVFSSS
jgi:hypothetical protein